MAAIVARAPPLPGRTSTPPPHLSLNTSSRGTPAAVPNKHLPSCSPGPRPAARGLDTPPSSPPVKDVTVEETSVTNPPTAFPKLINEPPVYSIDAHSVAKALAEQSTRPLPNPDLVFPWLHGLHADNQIQLAFFVARKKSLRRVPACLRSITIVKAGGNLGCAKLKGAVSSDELLCAPKIIDADAGSFIDCDPRDGFSIRNFQIQACKVAMLSDVFVYGDNRTSREEVFALARRLSTAQREFRERQRSAGHDVLEYHTFVISDDFSVFETEHPELVAVDSFGNLTGNVMDFFFAERMEMANMSKASEISSNVCLGPTPDPMLDPSIGQEPPFDLLIDTSDLAHIPDPQALRALRSTLEDPNHPPIQVEFPSSGSILPPTWSHTEVDMLMEMCQLIYDVANPKQADERDRGADVCDDDHDSDCIMLTNMAKPKRVLIHCTDGYTESSLLGLAYFMYAEGLPAHEAWVQLHREKKRNFFAYPTDVALLMTIQPRILEASPRWKGSILNVKEPAWLSRIDGSLPSRILPYMYLGNLNHANNPELLKELGITRILSVGEPVSWPKEVEEKWARENLLFINNIQDNGVDSLTDEFERCLKFIEQGKQQNAATLVHCRVGVSRSATICIAEVMKEFGLSFPRAYCFVRARRLNVIIQPHLRFAYELLKWEERQRRQRGEPLRRELEWASVAREIALMNKPYSRQ